MMDHATKMKVGFKWMAPIYDCFDLAFRLEPGRNPREALIRKIPRHRVRVDLCTGTGAIALLIAENRPESEVVGIDLSPDMLARARVKMQERRLSNVAFREMDASTLEFADSRFDAVTISFGLHEMPRDLMLRVLAEAARVASAGASLYIVDYEREGGVLRRAALSAFLWLLEPKHMPKFLAYDWSELLASVGWHLEVTETRFCSKLMVATRV
jgi:ubiquinone/menaquinone biosynthesis C-methylase UbiE